MIGLRLPMLGALAMLRSLGAWAPGPDAQALLEELERGAEELDTLADGVPDSLADAERQLSPTIAEFLNAGAERAILPLLAIAVVWLIGAVIRRRLAAKPDSPTPGPPAVGASLVCVAVYLFGRVFDPLLMGLLDRPPWFPEQLWGEVGWFEWKLLGRPLVWGALPLSRHPGLAVLIHVALWTGLWVLLWWAVRAILDWLADRQLGFGEPTRDLPGYFRWVGASTTRRADRRFRQWIGWVVLLLLPIHAVAGMSLTENPGSLPAPGAWVTGGFVLWTLAFHLWVEGKPPLVAQDEDEDEDEAEDELHERRLPPLIRLREALDQLRPGVELEALELRGAQGGRRVEFPAAIAPLVREVFADLTGEQQLWSHQAELLEHFGELWRMQASAERGEVPTLAEERATKVIHQAEGTTPHALMLAPEGSGRTTLTVLAALHVFFDRGATSLIIVRDRATATSWAKLLERALLGSSARWNVLVCVAGEDLGAALIAERTPAIVVADLEACESEVLCDPRTDNYLARLGLVVADDVDGFTGVAEMHLQMCVRRLWALLDHLHEVPYPAALLATCGVGASGMDAWAKHVLAVPMRLFGDDGAPTRERVLLRRRDLVDGIGNDIPLSVIAEACDLAELPWHLRLAGDAERGVRRATFDLGNLRRHHRDDPRDAAIVIVEGTYPDVRREADRLAHAGMALDREAFPGRGPVVLVLAPPGDEEMVLHEEAEDAIHRELVASLPRAIPLTEPRVVRQRHFDRAIGREQDLRALRDRFGGRFVDETVASLGEALRLREVLHIDPLTDDIVPQTLLRSAREGALGQPIDAGCVSDRGSRTEVVDAGTSEVLLTIDAAVALAVYPPGAIFMHPRGRFMVLEDKGGSDARQILAEQVGGRERTTKDRTLLVDLDGAPQWTERQFGGRKLPVCLTHAQLCERLHGVRRYAPGPTLVDQRIYEQPLELRYGTDACLIDTRIPPPEASEVSEPSDAPASDSSVASDSAASDSAASDSSGASDAGASDAGASDAGASDAATSGASLPGPDDAEPQPTTPSDDALIPLAAALRMILPGYLRAAGELVDVDLIDVDGRRALCVFDRTPGGSGFARHVCERGLRELLELARMVLERCVGAEFARLRHIHDRAPDSDLGRWRVGEALSWLDAILEPPPPPISEDDEPDQQGPRVEFTAGEGVGDLGRLWISRSGRTDDLVWTRHSWWSPVAVAGHPRGKLFFDVAVERPAIAAARRRAVGFASTLLLESKRLDLDSSEAYGDLLDADRADLEPIRARLEQLCAEHFVETVLALVAAIPISPRPLVMADRGPLAVLARRRADVDAKLLLACALLPRSAAATIVTGPEGQGWLRVEHARPKADSPGSDSPGSDASGSDASADAEGSKSSGSKSSVKTWSLDGPRPVLVDEEPARRATLILDLGDP